MCYMYYDLSLFLGLISGIVVYKYDDKLEFD